MKNKVSEIIRQVAVDNPTEMVSPARLNIGDRLPLHQFIEKEEGDPRQMGFLEMNRDILSPSFMRDWEMDITVTGVALGRAEPADGSEALWVVNVSVAVLDSVDDIHGSFWQLTTKKVDRFLPIWNDTSWLTGS